jgi:hypothetical protein
MRYSDVIQNQVNSLRKRWLIDRLRTDTLSGAYWGVMSSTYDYPGAEARRFGYSSELALGHIARIRTDLDPFSPNEIAVLVKHGYELTDVAVNTHAPKLIAANAPSMSNWPPRLLSEIAVKRALRGSSRRRIVRFSARHRAGDLLS